MLKKIRRHWFIALLLTFIVGVAIYRIFFMLMFMFYKPPHFPTMVDAATVKMQPWQKQIHSTGTLNAIEGIQVKAEKEGRVTDIFFASGKYVQQGEPLIQIFDEDLKAQLMAQQAQLKLSELDFQRQQTLVKTKSTSMESLDKARTQLEAARAELQRIQAELMKTLIKAPFAGRIGLKHVNIGDYVQTGDILVGLQALEHLRVDFSIPEVYLSELALGQKVMIQSRAYPDEKFIGKIDAFDSQINEKSRTLAVRAAIDNPNFKLLPGHFVDVILYVGEPKKMVTIPLTAVVYDETGDYVYRIVEGKAVKTLVKTGEIQNDDIAIAQGLGEKDLVIFAGLQKIGDGSDVIDRKTIPVQTEKH